MKRLFIVRHAKSSWEFPLLSDFDRPLNSRGKRDLPDMAERFAKLSIQPDLLISSPANRAITTAFGHASALGIDKEEIAHDPLHYHASSRELMQLIRQIDDEKDCVMIFGHNPGLTDLINDLTEFDLDNLPTCAIFGINFKIESWEDVERGLGRKIYYDYPKSILK